MFDFAESCEKIDWEVEKVYKNREQSTRNKKEKVAEMIFDWYFLAYINSLNGK